MDDCRLLEHGAKVQEHCGWKIVRVEDRNRLWNFTCVEKESARGVIHYQSKMPVFDEIAIKVLFFDVAALERELCPSDFVWNVSIFVETFRIRFLTAG